MCVVLIKGEMRGKGELMFVVLNFKERFGKSLGSKIGST